MLELVMVFGSLILGVDKVSSKAHPKLLSFNSLQALDSLSKCKVAMLKLRYLSRGHDTKRKSFYDKQRVLESPLVWSP